jgi:hypothetical protein
MSNAKPAAFPVSLPSASLAQTLAYDYPWVAPKFRERYAVSESEALDIFTETKRWLWLVAHAYTTPGAPTPLTLIGLDALSAVDEMWHTFMLFSEAYAEFCDVHFGWFIHHMPTTQQERERMMAERLRDPEGFERARLAEFRAQSRFVGETLGVETVRKWYDEYAVKYSASALDRLWRPRTLNLAAAQGG